MSHHLPPSFPKNAPPNLSGLLQRLAAIYSRFAAPFRSSTYPACTSIEDRRSGPLMKVVQLMTAVKVRRYSSALVLLPEWRLRETARNSISCV